MEPGREEEQLRRYSVAPCARPTERPERAQRRASEKGEKVAREESRRQCTLVEKWERRFTRSRER